MTNYDEIGSALIEKYLFNTGVLPKWVPLTDAIMRTDPFSEKCQATSHVHSSCWSHEVTNRGDCICSQPPAFMVYADEPMVKLSTVIIHLNDTHQMTREQIADWLDELQDVHGLDLTLVSPNSDRA